ncbi:hypothetical protein [Scytonema millei]|uniref:Uncharacterized protein n=1 Tax=Scytonema millei VB511283 TaxID=1245923 RepID=A0A9X5I365_9CYAN|nr:hypothetical protein [Scytonema millei]NHC33212.1 hypothetical protein [Scytonema millei VB511283]
MSVTDDCDCPTAKVWEYVPALGKSCRANCANLTRLPGAFYFVMPLRAASGQ